MTQFTESIVEDAALAWLETLGYAVLHRRLRHALVRLNPELKAAIDKRRTLGRFISRVKQMQLRGSILLISEAHMWQTLDVY